MVFQAILRMLLPLFEIANRIVEEGDDAITGEDSAGMLKIDADPLNDQDLYLVRTPLRFCERSHPQLAQQTGSAGS